MKLSKKSRLLLSMASLLICFLFVTPAVSADTLDDVYSLETETTSLSAEDAKEFADGRTNYYTIKTNLDNLIESLKGFAGYDYEKLEFIGKYYLNSAGTDMFVNLAETVGEDGLGQFVSTGEYKINDVGENHLIETSVELKFDNISLNMVITFKAYEPDFAGLQLESAKFEKMGGEPQDAGNGQVGLLGKFKEAGVNTLIGMSVVFVVLILISLIIYCFNFIPKIQAVFSRKSENEEAETKTDVMVRNTEEEVQQDDLELIAVISAAIAASENTTTDSFVVRSIRKRR